MRVHVLQHVPFEGLGSIAPWLEAHAARVSWTRFFDGDPLPDPAGFELVIALGGPMSVNDRDLFPWLADEERFLAEAVRSGIAVLGICLGAQLIASSLGAAVHRATHKEIGFFPIEACAGGEELFSFPAPLTVFHWHGETFALPDGALRLAKSEACANQAFQVGARAIGLQFHIETTPASAEAMLEHCAGELVAGPWIQSADEIRARAAERCAPNNELMAALLGYLVRPA